MAEKIFVDTNPLIYLLGKKEPYYEKVLNFFSDKIQNEVEFYTSTITDAEFLVKPTLDKDYTQISLYEEFLKRLGFLKCYVNEQIAKRSAEIRAKYAGVKLADSLQLATSIECNCDCFFTNDIRLKQVVEAKVLYLGDFK